jgi:hypothetical protein
MACSTTSARRPPSIAVRQETSIAAVGPCDADDFLPDSLPHSPLDRLFWPIAIEAEL